MRDSILIVDDIEINRIILREILLEDYDILEACDGPSALKVLFNAPILPQAVLLDIMMPGMDGFEVLRQIKKENRTQNIPVLFITAADAQSNESRGLKEGAVDYISKPFNPDVVKARVDNLIQLMRYRNNLEEMVKQKADELTRMHETVLETLATIIEYRSLESGTHVRRSSELTRLLVEELLQHPAYGPQLREQGYASMIKAVSLHDVGKVGIPDSILLKNGPLTAEEFEVIKEHTLIGASIIDSIAANVSDDAHYLAHCKDICRSHHERWDGKGYPDGLAGEQIPLSARLVSVIDVYDALVNKRCYKPAYTHREAMELIRQGAGTQFDPQIVRAMEAVEERFRCLELEMADPD